MNEVDAGRDRATLASVRHDADEPLNLTSPCLFIQSKDGDLGLTTLFYYCRTYYKAVRVGGGG